MEKYTCKECGNDFLYRKTLGRHVREVHKLLYIDYLKKHGESERITCHCGKVFQNTRHPGGSRSHGRRQKYCSALCSQRANTWWRVYGITPEDYWSTLEKQGSVCAVCGTDKCETDRQFAVDHEHVEGYETMIPEEKGKYFRGLLCNTCNRWRVAKNDLDTARKIVTYLEQHSSKT